MTGKHLWKHIEHPYGIESDTETLPPPATDTESSSSTTTSTTRTPNEDTLVKDAQAMTVIISSIGEFQFNYIINCVNAFEAWATLKRVYGPLPPDLERARIALKRRRRRPNSRIPSS